MTEPANWTNRTLWTGDNLDIMRGMNSESVDLIYLDPPFNSNRDYSAPIGSAAAGAAFKDTWTLSDVDEAWHGEIADRDPTLYATIDAAGHAHSKSMKSYLIMMAVRLMEMRRLLKPTGSLYLHCDPTASHYLKMLMDSVFGAANFRNEIVWCYAGGGQPAKDFPRKHDIILRYSKTDAYVFKKEDVRVPYDSAYKATVFAGKDTRAPGKTYTRNPDGKVVEDWWRNLPRPYGKEKQGYPTQKPLSLLDRIIRASSSEGDMVLDPFAGCATACVSADRLERQWVGIDLSPMAAKLVKSRLRKELGMFYDVQHRLDMPRRTDLGELPNYKTHRHTLYGRQEGICVGCRVMFPFRNMTVDHLVPQSRSGSDHLENLQLLCAACNSKKGTRSQEAFLAILKAEGIRD